MTTRDEISAARRKKRQRYRIRRLAALLASLGVVLLAAFIISLVTPTTLAGGRDWLRTVFGSGGQFPSLLSSSYPLEVETLSRSFAVLTEDELMVISSSGKRLLTASHEYSSAALAAGDSRILLFNRGSREAEVYNRTELLARLTTDYAIIDADISRAGVVGLLTESERYTCQLELLERGGYKKLFTWYGASGFPYELSISPDGELAAVLSLDTADAGQNTHITIIDLGAMKEQVAFSVDGLALRLLWGSNRVTALTEQGAFQYDFKGELKNSYTFSGLPIIRIAHGEGDSLVLAFGDNNRSEVNRLLLLDSDLSLRFEAVGVGRVDDLLLARDRIYTLGDSRVIMYTMRGEAEQLFETYREAVSLVNPGGLVAVLPDRAERLS